MDQHPQSTDLIPSSMEVGSPGGALDLADLDETEAQATQLMESPPSSSVTVLSGAKRGRRSHTETPKTNQAMMYRVSWEQVRLGLDRLVSSKSIAWYW